MSDLNVDEIRNAAGTGAPSFPNGLSVAGIGFKVSLDTNETATSTASVITNLSVTASTDFDTASGWSTANDRYTVTATTAGLWLFSFATTVANSGVNEISGPRLYLNGSGVYTSWNTSYGAGTVDIRDHGTFVLQLSDTDYVQLYKYSSVSRTLAAGGDNTFFAGVRLGD